MTVSGGDSRLQSNVIIGVFHQVLSLLINMVSKYAVRTYLGVEYLGLQTVFGNFCDIFTFAFMGIGTAMMYSLYRPLALGKRKELGGDAYYQVLQEDLPYSYLWR